MRILKKDFVRRFRILELRKGNVSYYRQIFPVRKAEIGLDKDSAE